MRRILAGILLLAASTWALDTYQGLGDQGWNPSSSQEESRIIAFVVPNPSFVTKNYQDREDPIKDGNTGHHGAFTTNQGGLNIGSNSEGPFGVNQGNFQQGGLYTGSNTGGPFVTKDFLRREDKSEDYGPITGSNEGYFGASNTNQGGLISGLLFGGPFGVNQVNYPQGGLFTGSNKGGPLFINNYQKGEDKSEDYVPITDSKKGHYGASSTNQGGLSSISNSEIPSLNSVYPGLKNYQLSGLDGVRNQVPQGELNRGNQIGGSFLTGVYLTPILGKQSQEPFALNQGNYQQGGLVSSINTGGPFNPQNYQPAEPIFRISGTFGTFGSSPGGLINGQNTGGPLDFTRGGQSENPFGHNQGYYSR